MTDRDAAIKKFLEEAGWAKAKRATLADDASFRRYERINLKGKCAVLMDAPPPKEDVRPFLKVGRALAAMGLSAPRILHADELAGFLLLEDLGDETYTRVLAKGGDEKALYRLATDLLIELHRRAGPEHIIGVSPYDNEKLLTEALLFTDWYLPAVRGKDTLAADRDEFIALWKDALRTARNVPSSLVLRDYHVDNLMWLADRDGVEACGLLDFQDAVFGPVTYDLVSLFEDARRDVDQRMAKRLLKHYLSAFPHIEESSFFASYAIMGAQRSTKILGIFTRLDRRDGKSGYLKHMDRTWRWLERDLAHPELAPLKAWFRRMIPKAGRKAPEPAPGILADKV